MFIIKALSTMKRGLSKEKGTQSQYERLYHLSKCFFLLLLLLFNQETKWPCVVKLSVFTGRGEGEF